jgi:hypothetical protein
MLSSWTSSVFTRLTLAGAHSARRLESYEGSAAKQQRTRVALLSSLVGGTCQVFAAEPSHLR